MSENFEDFFTFLVEKRGFALPENPCQATPIKSQATLQDFIQADQKRLPSRESFLSYLPQLLCQKNAGDQVEEIVSPYAPGNPGFSNKQQALNKKLLESNKRQLPPAHKVTAILARIDILAETVSKKQLPDKDYMRHIINEDMPRKVVADCEQRIINGSGREIQGLLHDDRITTIIEIKGAPTQHEFYLRALQEYGGRVGRTPSIIVLPNKEMVLLTELQIGQETQGFPERLFVPSVMASDFLPEERGLILEVREIKLASSNMEFEFECNGNTLKDRDQVKIMVSYNLGLLLTRPKTIAQLVLPGKEDC